jgi:hypothetical protein
MARSHGQTPTAPRVHGARIETCRLNDQNPFNVSLSGTDYIFNETTADTKLIDYIPCIHVLVLVHAICIKY